MDRKKIVEQIARVIHDVAPESEAVLYGSEARNEAREDSDIDVLIVLPDDSSETFSKRKIEISDRLYDVELSSGVSVSPLIVLRSMWARMTTPFTRNVAHDGILL